MNEESIKCESLKSIRVRHNGFLLDRENQHVLPLMWNWHVLFGSLSGFSYLETLPIPWRQGSVVNITPGASLDEINSWKCRVKMVGSNAVGRKYSATLCSFLEQEWTSRCSHLNLSSVSQNRRAIQSQGLLYGKPQEATLLVSLGDYAKKSIK